jgi:hypothetical protein
MAYKTFVAGTEGLASDMNTYLMNQVVMVFADAAARDAALTSPTEGMTVYLIFNDHFMVYSGSEWVKFDLGWNAWTPTFTNLTQGTGGVTQAYYARIGKTIVAQVYVTMGTTAPTVGGQISISLPVDVASANRSLVVGNAFMRDSVGGRSWLGTVFLSGSAPSVAKMQVTGANLTYAYAVTQTGTVPHTWAANDYFSFTIIYQGV